MIVPLEFRIERVERRGNFEALQVGASPAPPVYRALAILYDTENEQVKTYDLHSLVDRSHEPPRVGTITRSPLEANREYLTNLRDQLSEVLS